MNVSQFIVSELEKLGVEEVFTLVGGGSMYLNDAIHHSKLKPVYMLCESGASFAASAYAQYTGKIGVVVVTSGPGSTNALTGIVAAFQDSIPLLVISGDARVPLLEQREKYSLRACSAQDVDIFKIARPVTKYIETIMNPCGAKWIFDQAVKYAMSCRRGPVLINVPLDIQSAEYNESN